MMLVNDVNHLKEIIPLKISQNFSLIFVFTKEIKQIYDTGGFSVLLSLQMMGHAAVRY